MSVCLRHIQQASAPSGPKHGTEPLLLQWLCLCAGMAWLQYPEAQAQALAQGAPQILERLLADPHPEVL